jgi:hypothetical protein
MIIKDLKLVKATFLDKEEQKQEYVKVLRAVHGHLKQQELNFIFKSNSFIFSTGYKNNYDSCFKVLYPYMLDIRGLKTSKFFKASKFVQDIVKTQEDEDLDELSGEVKEPVLPQSNNIMTYEGEKGKAAYIFDLTNDDLDYKDLTIQVRAYFLQFNKQKYIKLKPYLLNERMELLLS